MTRGRIVDQVHGILAGQRIAFDVAADGRSFRVPVPGGSAAVEIDFEGPEGDRSVVRLRSRVLEALDVSAENRLEILEHLNALNQTALFGRFFLDADRSTIVLEHELLGDDMSADELFNALYRVGLTADQTDDDLQRALGTGRRAVELEATTGGSEAPGWEWQSQRQSPDPTTGPR
jgi:hypothetical protein